MRSSAPSPARWDVVELYEVEEDDDDDEDEDEEEEEDEDDEVAPTALLLPSTSCVFVPHTPSAVRLLRR